MSKATTKFSMENGSEVTLLVKPSDDPIRGATMTTSEPPNLRDGQCCCDTCKHSYFNGLTNGLFCQQHFESVTDTNSCDDYEPEKSNEN